MPPNNPTDTEMLDWLIKEDVGPVYVKEFGWMYLRRGDIAAAMKEKHEQE